MSAAGRCWGITDGSAGMVSQVRALATVLGRTPEMKTIALNSLFSWQPNIFYAVGYRQLILDYALDKSRSDALDPPWPELIISCGRKAALITMGMRWRAEQRQAATPLATRFIHIQHPQCSPANYDLVIAMAHDKLSADNVITTRYALHQITPEVLDKARAQYAPRFASLPKPHIGVLIGGSTNKYTLRRGAVEIVVHQLERLLHKTIGSLLITTSRRTGDANTALLADAFRGNPRVYFYNGVGDNPYLGLLAQADYLAVTNDSVNMMSEAVATGKPLYIIPFANHIRTKPADFAERLMAEGIARPIGDGVQPWSYTVDNEMVGLAATVKAKLGIA